MGWLIAALVIGSVAAAGAVVVDAIQTSNEHDYQKEQLKLENQKLLDDYKTTLLEMQSNLNSAEQSLSGFKEKKELTGVSILQAESDISGYETALERWKGDYDYQMNALYQQGLEQYNGLMNNWSAQEVINAETGRSGKTAEILEKQQKNKLISFVGSDLKLDSVGGMYAQARNELNLDLLADKISYQGQIDILNKSLDIYKDNLIEYDSQIANITDSISGYKEKIGEYEQLIQKQQQKVNAA